MLKHPASPIRQALRYCGVLALLATAGWLLQPLQQRVTQQELTAGLRLPPPQADKTDALSQQLAIFALGGLRTFAAEILTIDTTNAWLQQDWPRARQRWEQITTLCPRRVNYWVRASRDLAKNAVAWVNSNELLTQHEQALLSKDYLDAAEQFLLEGLANNPDSVLLWLQLAAFDEDLNRRTNFTRAVEDYRRALELGASPMYHRWVFYNLCRIRGREQEAWKLGCQLYHSNPDHRSPSLRCLLLALQNKLNIPQAERFTLEELFGSRERSLKFLRPYLHNDLRFPTTGIREIVDELSSAQSGQ